MKELSNVLDCSGLTLKEANRKVRELINQSHEIEMINASHINGLCAGLDFGKIKVHCDVGDYFGMLNSGCRLYVSGSTGKYLGDGMTSGRIEISGNAGDYAAVYCCGGELRIKGSAGDFLGAMNKGATIIIDGDIGDNTGTYMVGGDIFVLGNAGNALGDYIIRGGIYIIGSYEGLGHNAKQDRLRSADIDKINSVLQYEGLTLNPRSFKKIVPASLRPFYGEKKTVSKGDDEP
ncbi:MAG: hypothetical protein QXN93_02285 [Methanomassiliicoccales archaeon]